MLVPKDAVVRRGPDEMVFVVSDGQAKAVKVSTGRGYRALLEVADGDLKPGQQVVTLGNEVLRDGAKVQLGNGPGPGARPGGRRPGAGPGAWAGRSWRRTRVGGSPGRNPAGPERGAMGIVDFCVRNPVSVTVGIILAVLFGTIALLRLPVQMIPTVDRPEITVTTEYSGAGPLEVEREVTDRLEERLNAVERLKEVSSSSIEGRSRVVLKFDWGTNKDIARLGVSEKLDTVRDLPPDVGESRIRAVNTDEESPISWIMVDTERDLNEVWEELKDVIVPQMERVPGVGAVWRFGGRDRQVHVTLDPRAMAARGITVSDVRQAITRENRNVKGGDLSEGKRRHVVRTLGQFEELRHIADVVVRHDVQGPVYVRDVAAVSFGHEDRDFAVRIDGRPALGMGVLRRSGANTMEVMAGVREAVRRLDERYRGKGIGLTMVYDETDYIHDSIDLVTRNVYYAVTLAVLVLLLFLRSPASIVIVAVAIPVSIVSTFVVLNITGSSLNVIMLAGLAFATGMVVDNAVVVLENVFRHRDMGKGRVRAAVDGAREVGGAILASTLTTVAVFVPVLFVRQEAGQLFRDIALAVSVAVALSLVVALTVVPMLSAHILAERTRARFRRLRAAMSVLDRGGAGFASMVLGLLAWLQRGAVRRLAVVLFIVGGSVALAWWFAPPLDYLPRGNRNFIFGVVRMPPGFNTDQKESIIKEIESRVRAIPEIERMFAVIRLDTPIMGAIVKEPHTQPRGHAPGGGDHAPGRRRHSRDPGRVHHPGRACSGSGGPSSAATTWPWTSRETTCRPSATSPAASRDASAAWRG